MQFQEEINYKNDGKTIKQMKILTSLLTTYMETGCQLQWIGHIYI